MIWEQHKAAKSCQSKPQASYTGYSSNKHRLVGVCGDGHSQAVRGERLTSKMISSESKSPLATAAAACNQRPILIKMRNLAITANLRTILVIIDVGIRTSSATGSKFPIASEKTIISGVETAGNI